MYEKHYIYPINGKKKHFDLKKLKGIIAKIKDLEGRIDSLPTTEAAQKMISEALEKNKVGQNFSEVYESKIVNIKEEVIRLSNLGFSCQPIGRSEWLMRKKIIGQM
jgi:hypothetical protein